jgi:hypothetical protein
MKLGLSSVGSSGMRAHVIAGTQAVVAPQPRVCTRANISARQPTGGISERRANENDSNNISRRTPEESTTYRTSRGCRWAALRNPRAREVQNGNDCQRLSLFTIEGLIVLPDYRLADLSQLICHECGKFCLFVRLGNSSARLSHARKSE